MKYAKRRRMVKYQFGVIDIFFVCMSSKRLQKLKRINLTTKENGNMETKSIYSKSLVSFKFECDLILNAKYIFKYVVPF